MSYCGRCGTFYNAACPHWPACSPAPNPHDEQRRSLIRLACLAAALFNSLGLVLAGMLVWVLNHGGHL